MLHFQPLPASLIVMIHDLKCSSLINSYQKIICLQHIHWQKAILGCAKLCSTSVVILKVGRYPKNLQKNGRSFMDVPLAKVIANQNPQHLAVFHIHIE